MSDKRITRREIREYSGDKVSDFICDILVNTANYFGVLESRDDVTAIADFISNEVRTALEQITEDIEVDYWD